MVESKESIRNKLIANGILSLVVFFIPIISSIYSPLFISESQGSWFQRSGSLMVVLGAFIEFRLFSIRAHFNIVGAVWDLPFETPTSYCFWYNLIAKAILFAIAIGTIIWGYGDLLFKDL